MQLRVLLCLCLCKLLLQLLPPACQRNRVWRGRTSWGRPGRRGLVALVAPVVAVALILRVAPKVAACPAVALRVSLRHHWQLRAPERCLRGRRQGCRRWGRRWCSSPMITIPLALAIGWCLLGRRQADWGAWWLCLALVPSLAARPPPALALLPSLGLARCASCLRTATTVLQFLGGLGLAGWRRRPCFRCFRCFRCFGRSYGCSCGCDACRHIRHHPKFVGGC